MAKTSGGIRGTGSRAALSSSEYQALQASLKDLKIKEKNFVCLCENPLCAFVVKIKI